MSNDEIRRIGVIYYTQSGQILDVLKRLFSNFPTSCKIDYIEIVPDEKFPLPWTAYDFFNSMPECVSLDGCSVSLRGYDEERNYDLIILAYQPWFLSPSIPFMGFLNSGYAKKLLNNKNIVTVIGARNMWLRAQEIVKSKIIAYNGNLVGNLPLVDTNPNLISVLTVIRWAFKGKKEASRFLPAAGIQTKELEKLPYYGVFLLDAIQNQDYDKLQNKWIRSEAVSLKPDLVLLEQTGIKQFRKFAALIKKQGPPRDIKRKPIVRIFMSLLIVGIFILSPIKTVISKIQVFLKRKKLKKDMLYFQSIAYDENMSL